MESHYRQHKLEQKPFLKFILSFYDISQIKIKYVYI